MRLTIISIKVLLFNHIICLKVKTFSSVKQISKISNLSSAHISRCGRSHYRGPAQRIIGGRVAQNGEFPWTVSLHRNGHFKCGGSIIDAFHVLTAAHCVDGTHPSEIDIKYNSLHQFRNGSQRTASRLIIHPKYSTRTVDNDIALIRLRKALVLGRLNSGTICLPSKGERLEDNQMMTVSGWGLTNQLRGSQILRTTDIPVISMNTCRKQYRHLPDLYTITDNMICAGHTTGGHDSCNGDSGGPLVTSFNGRVFVLIGIVSKGLGCALPNKAGVYTKVSNYVQWIQQNIN